MLRVSRRVVAPKAVAASFVHGRAKQGFIFNSAATHRLEATGRVGARAVAVGQLALAGVAGVARGGGGGGGGAPVFNVDSGLPEPWAYAACYVYVSPVDLVILD